MASFSTLLVPLIKEVLLKEIGDASLTPLNWKRVSANQYKFLVDINDFTEVVTVDFEEFTEMVHRQYYLPQKYRNLEKVYNVGFVVSDSETQAAKTDVKTLLTINSTVVDIIKDFLASTDVDALYIKGSPKDAGSKDISQKSNLYKAFIKKGLEGISDYGFDTYKEGFILIKK